MASLRIDDHARETAPDARVATLLSASAVPALLIAGEESEIVLASPSFLGLTGWTPEAAVGADARHVLRPDGDRETATALSAALAGERPEGVEILGLTRQGTTYWAQVFVSAVTGTDLRLVQVIDITRAGTPKGRCSSRASARRWAC